MLETYFQNTSVQQFADDLAEKDTVILLRDPDDTRVVGFSTLMKIGITIENRNVVGFFSGDTIIAREHWGSSLLARLWVTTVFREAESHPAARARHAVLLVSHLLRIQDLALPADILRRLHAAPGSTAVAVRPAGDAGAGDEEIRRRLPRRSGHRPVPPRQPAAPRRGRGDRSETARPARRILHPDEPRSLARRRAGMPGPHLPFEPDAAPGCGC